VVLQNGLMLPNQRVHFTSTLIFNVMTIKIAQFQNGLCNKIPTLNQRIFDSFRIQNQPVRGINGKIPAAAGPNFQGAIKADGTSFDPTGSASSFGLGALFAAGFIYLLS
jgi:hypothetical protein